ncbi:MAG: hypothetical protein HY587_05260 [Candidatus Omnitrophica bacterium]|nr:hypothetical protein [Candidatus Omnitrophota bacterium]
MTVTMLVKRLARNRRHRGKHLIVIEGRVFAARSAAHAKRLFDRLTRMHPHATPTLLYIPKSDALVL